MLVLSRKRGEQIRIGRDVVITVVEFKTHPKAVRLGIEAPRNIPVHRAEVSRQIEQTGIDLKNPKENENG